MATLSKILTGAFVAALCLPVLQAQAALVDRGGGMLYDDGLKVTWLQDANYAKTSGYCNTAGNCLDTVGRMTWTQATTWANNLVYGGYSDWRLASNSPVDGTPSGWDNTLSADGTTDVGYNITSPSSELSYMYYVNLNLKGFFSTRGILQPDYGIFGNGTSGGQNDVGPVKNLQSSAYWSGTVDAYFPATDAWSFKTILGAQFSENQSDRFFAWAARDGDVTVAAAPVPGSVALLAGGLALLSVVTRRRGRLGASEA
jgi:hypothetical protein